MLYSKFSKNDREIIWTKHVQEKMRQYGFSEGKLRHLLNNFERKEEGIAPGTIALMVSSGTKKHPTEIWLMYENVDSKKKIITAWRYPGISRKSEVPIPDNIIKELKY